MTFLLLTVRFVDDRYHGLVDRGGPPEWPPSPFRLFSALVAGVARRGELDTAVGKSLEWLQTLDPPIIISPRSKTGQATTRYGPNNDGDSEKCQKNPEKCRSAKHTEPTLFLLERDQKPEVYYVWDIRDHPDAPIERIRDAARRLTTLGWGIDMAFADADRADETKLQMLNGVRWHPKPGVWRNAGMLRTPVADADTGQCTLSDLRHCHSTFVNRIEHGKPLHTVDKPRVFERMFYTSSERPVGRPVAIFKLRTVDGSRFRYPHSRLIHLAGMIRHLAIEAMKASPPTGVKPDWVETYVTGHMREDRKEHRQLSYLPLPSVGYQHTDPGVQRIMIAAPPGDDVWLDHVARHLAGRQLEPLRGDEFGGSAPPFLVPIRSDNVSRCYTRGAAIWHSFTPVILPGHDDHKPEKTRKLIERALQQSGIDQPCEFEWSAFSRFPKALSAHKYDRDGRLTGYIRPDHLLSQTAVHLTLRFKNGLMMPGPLAIGAGRHCGLGLFAAVESS